MEQIRLFYGNKAPYSHPNHATHTYRHFTGRSGLFSDLDYPLYWHHLLYCAKPMPNRYTFPR